MKRHSIKNMLRLSPKQQLEPRMLQLLSETVLFHLYYLSALLAGFVHWRPYVPSALPRHSVGKGNGCIARHLILVPTKTPVSLKFHFSARKKKKKRTVYGFVLKAGRLVVKKKYAFKCHKEAVPDICKKDSTEVQWQFHF